MLLLGGCAPAVTDRTPEPPRAPADVAPERLLKATPETLALTREDMPAGFQLAAEKSAGPEYVALFLRPAALDPAASGGNQLLSVLTSVAVYTSTAQAQQVFQEASGPAAGRNGDIELLSSEATDLIAEPFAGAAQGVDAAAAERVSYSLMGQRIFEYGHRIRQGNVLAYVVVAATGSPDEPAHLLEDANDLVQRQIDHIVAAAGGAP